jgi:segregation and condensation protein A
VPFSPSLKNFEGPLELLLLLIQKDELDIKSLTLREVIDQFSEHVQKEVTLDQHAENLARTATLLLWKSQKLLPGEEPELEEEGDRMEIFQKLIEYCRFKEVARLLSSKEEQQQKVFYRPQIEIQKEKGLGVGSITLGELSSLLKDVLKRVPNKAELSTEPDPWEVSTFIERLYSQASGQLIPFFDFFENSSCKEEAIVTFLAMLELMKQHKLSIIIDSNPPMVQWHLSTC